MRCPREGTPLVATPFMGVTMDACPSCDGTFLDAGELAQIQALDEDLVDDEGLEARDPRGEIACPRCTGTMQTRFYSEARRVLIDRCRTCGGLWLDHEELKNLLVETFNAHHPEAPRTGP